MTSSVKRRSGMGEGTPLPWDGSHRGNGIHSGMQCRAVSKVSVVGNAVSGSLCFPNKEVLVSGWSGRSRTVFARRLGIVSRLAGFRKDILWVGMGHIQHR